jgi:hypothetical protein
VTAAYAVRVLDLAAGKDFNLKVFNNGKNYTVAVAVGKAAKMHAPGRGLVSVLKVQPRMFLKGAPAREARVSGYMEQGQGHAPVFMTIKAPVFTRLTAVRVE